MKSKKNQYKKKSSKKMVTRYLQLPPGDLIGIAELIITGFKILQMIKAGGVEVDPDPEEKEIDNIETIDADAYVLMISFRIAFFFLLATGIFVLIKGHTKDAAIVLLITSIWAGIVEPALIISSQIKKQS